MLGSWVRAPNESQKRSTSQDDAALRFYALSFFVYLPFLCFSLFYLKMLAEVFGHVAEAVGQLAEGIGQRLGLSHCVGGCPKQMRVVC